MTKLGFAQPLLVQWDPEYVWGLIDAYAALTYFNNESPPADVHDIAISRITVPATVGIGDPVMAAAKPM